MRKLILGMLSIPKPLEMTRLEALRALLEKSRELQKDPPKGYPDTKKL